MPIRITGLNSGLDTESIISALVSSYNYKTQKYEKAQTKLSWKQDAWKELNTKIYSLYTSVGNLRFSKAYNLKSASVSDSTKVSVTASSGAVNGTYSIQVTSLAKAGYLTGAKLSKDKKDENGNVVTDTEGNPVKEGATSATTLSELGYTGEGSITIGGKSITVKGDTKISEVISGCPVLLGGLQQLGRKFVVIPLFLGGNCHGVHRLRQTKLYQGQRILGGSQRIAGFGDRQLGGNTKVSRLSHLDFLQLLANAAIELANLLLFFLRQVEQLGIGMEASAHHLQIGELAGELVAGGLDAENNGRSGSVEFHRHLLLHRRHGSLDGMGGIRSDVCDKVQQGNQSAVLLRITGKGGNDAVVGHGNLKAGDDFLLGQLTFINELHQKVVITLGGGTSQYPQGILVQVLVVSRNVGGSLHRTVTSHQVGLSVEHVDDPLEIAAAAHGNGDGTHLHAELLADILNGAIVVRALILAVVQKGDAGLVPTIQVTPQLDGLDLGAGAGVNHHQRQLAGTEGGDDLTGKVGGTRSVPHIDEDTLPVQVGQGGID